jgi:peptidoglycan hydrolase-like protein with peptidoglycan-binding domain
VEDIQRTLQDVGYGVRRTGKLDDQTRGAISRFQRDRGLPETGALDGRTASQLGVSRRGLEAERMEHGT